MCKCTESCTKQIVISQVVAYSFLIFYSAIVFLALFYGTSEDYTPTNLSCAADAIVPLNTWLEVFGITSIAVYLYLGFIFLIQVMMGWLNTLDFCLALVPSLIWNAIWTGIGCWSLWAQSTGCKTNLRKLYYSTEAVVIGQLVVCVMHLVAMSMSSCIVKYIKPPSEYHLLHADV